MSNNSSTNHLSGDYEDKIGEIAASLWTKVDNNRMLAVTSEHVNCQSITVSLITGNNKAS